MLQRLEAANNSVRIVHGRGGTKAIGVLYSPFSTLVCNIRIFARIKSVLPEEQQRCSVCL